MGYFFFDESIHPRGEFILGAFVYTDERLAEAVDQMLVTAGLKPGVDEVKSRTRADSSPELQALRNSLAALVHHNARVGLVIVPLRERSKLGREALHGLRKIINENSLSQPAHELHFDQGVFRSKDLASKLAKEVGLDPTHVLHASDDSRLIREVQLADLVAHTCSTMLLAHMGVVTKSVPDPELPDDPEQAIPLEFELWARLRYSFFARSFPGAGGDALSSMTVDTTCGLHIAASCGDALRAAALARFGSTYLGCIH